MKRRDFVKTGAIAGAASITSLNSCTQSVTRQIPAYSCDVLVIGGGTAGTIAAIQAGRLGAKTILVEAGSQLGGTTTTGGVNLPGLFHAWGKQVISGIGWELVTKTVELNNDPLPDFTKLYPKQHWKHQVWLSGELYACVIEEAAIEAGVDLKYYQFPQRVENTNNGWDVEIVGKNSQSKVSAKVLIDCTGNASVVDMAGFNRMIEDELQPGTLMYQLKGYDKKDLDMEEVETNYKIAMENGKLKKGDAQKTIGSFLGNGGYNNQHTMKADNSTAELHTKTNIEGRKSLLRMFRFLKEQKGMENLKISFMRTETAVRETYRIEGETIISHEDYIKGKVFEDAVSYAYYPVDVHDEKGVVPVQLKDGIVPTIPLSALIPKGSENIYVAGRCISSDRLANSGLRVQASCMAMGQAVGAAAAICSKNNSSTNQLSLVELREKLKENGAIVPV